ncbi:MAG: HslU--HslV peptidase ATPase subunit, partial [Gammaproteobacteria bacterium]
LSTDDFKRILVEPDASLTEQYQALLKTEGLCIDFTACGIERIAQTAWRVNESTENIGARRLHTVLERVLESASFDAEALAKQFNHDTPMPIDAAYVDEQLKALEHDEDLSRYIL